MPDDRLGFRESASRERVTVPVEKNDILLRQSGSDRQIGRRRDDLDRLPLCGIRRCASIKQVSDTASEKRRD